MLIYVYICIIHIILHLICYILFDQKSKVFEVSLLTNCDRSIQIQHRVASRPTTCNNNQGRLPMCLGGPPAP